MLDDRVAHCAATARDDVQMIGGEPALVEEQSGERDRGERRLAGRLQHDGTTGGDRGCELVGDEVEREVERADRADDTDRKPQAERELPFARDARVHRDDVAAERARRDRGEREGGNRALRLDPGGLDRFRGFTGDDLRELLHPFVQQPRRGVQDLRALPLRQRASGAGLGGGRDSAVDLLGTALRHATEERVVVR